MSGTTRDIDLEEIAANLDGAARMFEIAASQLREAKEAEQRAKDAGDDKNYKRKGLRFLVRYHQERAVGALDSARIDWLREGRKKLRRNLAPHIKALRERAEVFDRGSTET